MTDCSELKRLAVELIAANDLFNESPQDNEVGDAWNLANDHFAEAASPEVILALIAENERNQRMLLAACMDLGATGNALGADMNADGDELLGMVIDLKAQNTRMLEWLRDISRTSGDKGAVMGARQLLKEFAE